VGYRHYKEMLMQATEIDCRAMSTFIDLLAHNDKIDKKKGVKSFWGGMPLDRIMHCARELTRMHDYFIDDMQELLAAGCVEVKARHKFTGEVFKINDGDIFEFDTPVIDIKTFHEILLVANHYDEKGNSASNN